MESSLFWGRPHDTLNDTLNVVVDDQMILIVDDLGNTWNHPILGKFFFYISNKLHDGPGSAPAGFFGGS